MEKEIIRRGKRTKPEIRIMRFFNAIIDEATPMLSPYHEINEDLTVTAPKLLGIYVVNRTLEEIVKGTGSSLASFWGERTVHDFHSVSAIVDHYSDRHLGLEVGNKRNYSGSIIVDYPVLHSVSNAAQSGELLSRQVIDLDIARYKLAID